MNNSPRSIELDIARKLNERDYRRRFFLVEGSARIAKQLIALRKLRGLSQLELAKLAEMKQPAISRAERADYHNWSFNTLRRLADALDARLRVEIEPAEDVIAAYDNEKSTQLAHVGIPIQPAPLFPPQKTPGALPETISNQMVYPPSGVRKVAETAGQSLWK